MLNRLVVPSEVKFQAQSEAVDTLLKSWEAEIERGAERLREEGKRIEAQKTEDAIESARTQSKLLQQHDQVERLDANAFAQYLGGLAISAEASDSIAVTIPAGFRVATALIAGPAVESLLDRVEDEILEGALDSPLAKSDASIRWALGHGFMPHPGDLAQSMNRHGLDAEFAHRFADLGQKLEQLGDKAFRNPQLQGVVGHEKVGLLKEQVALLGAYTPERLVSLATNPASLRDRPTPVLPTAGKGALKPTEFNRMLDKLFSG